LVFITGGVTEELVGIEELVPGVGTTQFSPLLDGDVLEIIKSALVLLEEFPS